MGALPVLSAETPIADVLAHLATDGGVIVRGLLAQDTIERFKNDIADASVLVFDAQVNSRKVVRLILHWLRKNEVFDLELRQVEELGVARRHDITYWYFVRVFKLRCCFVVLP